jgi:hypothetical protein
MVPDAEPLITTFAPGSGSPPVAVTLPLIRESCAFPAVSKHVKRMLPTRMRVNFFIIAFI